jgi:hypothetical protein
MKFRRKHRNIQHVGDAPGMNYLRFVLAPAARGQCRPLAANCKPQRLFRMIVACSSDFSCAKTEPLQKQDSHDLRLKTPAVSSDHFVGKRK